MGPPPQDRPFGAARRIPGRDSAGKPDQNPVCTPLPDRQHAAARDARNALLGAAANASAHNGRLPDRDAEIDAEAQSRMPWAEGIASQIAQPQLSSGSCDAKGAAPDAPRRTISRRV